jgi:hypothetical protein
MLVIGIEFAISIFQINVTFSELQEDICDVMNKQDHQANFVISSKLR